MPEPKQHYEERPWLETIARYIPGFRGYLEAEYRRESDALQRQWLADRLQRAKLGIDELARTLTEQAQLDALPRCEQLRARLDKFISRLRGAMPGYSAFFDLVQIDRAVLDRVYKHDVDVMDRVEQLAEEIEQLPEQIDQAGKALTKASAEVTEVEQSWQKREEILQGLS